jgi:hypothetical protein
VDDLVFTDLLLSFLRLTSSRKTDNDQTLRRGRRKEI